MKGILLAGGAGTRLAPMTRVVSKQLLPVHDKPLVYYPLSTLMLAGVRDVLLIATPEDLPRFSALLGDGSALGLRLAYEAQPAPEGLAQALVIGREFVGAGPVAMILGDNLFFGAGLGGRLRAAVEAMRETPGATIFTYPVGNPQRYGVVQLDTSGRVVGVEEKPPQPRSNLAITGLYLFDGRACGIAAGLGRSTRGQYEITDVIAAYLADGTLRHEPLGRGMAWLDTGTVAALQEAARFVEAIEARQGLKIGCPEEVAFRMGFISREQLRVLAAPLLTSEYGEYLLRVAAEGA